MRKTIFLVFLTSIFSCNSEILPEKYDMVKGKSFYVGLSHLVVYDIHFDQVPELDEIKNFPKYWDAFDDDFNVEPWHSLKTESKIYENLTQILEANQIRALGKDDSEKVSDLVDTLESSHNRFFVSGVYKNLGPEMNLKRRYHHIFVLDKFDKSLITIEIP